MKKLLFSSMIALLAIPAMADNEVEKSDTLATVNEFRTEESYSSGFLTEALNREIAKNFEAPAADEEVEYGRKVTQWASAPKFAGYFMSGYWYSSKEGAHSGDGFKVKNVRAIVSGTLLNDFAYLMQVQLTNDKFHMKDYWLEWKKYKEFQIKGGQFIRVFGYENPYNPYEFHEHSYAQITQKLCGQADRVVGDNGGGRDQGIQIQGDLFPMQDGHRLLHYQMMVSNGQTINTSDANSQKDITGCIAIQPIEGLRLAVWGWSGNFTGNNVTVQRKRYMFSAFYDKNDWTFRSEYAHSTGGKTTDPSNDKAQGWYATVGIPCTKMLKTWLKYDAYQDDGTKNSTRSIWSVAAHIALHKNLYFLPTFGYVNEKVPGADANNYCEASIQMGVRF